MLKLLNNSKDLKISHLDSMLKDPLNRLIRWIRVKFESDFSPLLLPLLLLPHPFFLPTFESYWSLAKPPTGADMVVVLFWLMPSLNSHRLSLPLLRSCPCSSATPACSDHHPSPLANCPLSLCAWMRVRGLGFRAFGFIGAWVWGWRSTHEKPHFLLKSFPFSVFLLV